MTVEAYEAPPRVIANVERMMREAGIEVGGVEYVIDDADGAIALLRYQCVVEFCGGSGTHCRDLIRMRGWRII